mgnify:FL=1|jgi:hypothetical protein|tara:strand:- start:291 stop:578 length:288 start_codon:yes stop_codon:yes gene_type:complete
MNHEDKSFWKKLNRASAVQQLSSASNRPAYVAEGIIAKAQQAEMQLETKGYTQGLLSQLGADTSIAPVEDTAALLTKLTTTVVKLQEQIAEMQRS